jgi:preprotein translocase subunit SecG
MQSVLIVIHLMVVATLVLVVLLQRSEGGAIGIGGGGFMTGRGQANALTRATAILAALFFATSLGLTILARFNQAPEVIFQSVAPVGPNGPAKEGEGKGNLLDQLQRLEDQSSKPPALPPGIGLPPAAPQPGKSVLQTGPAAPQGTNLPLPALPGTPLVPAAPAQPAPAVPVQPFPLKTPPPASAPPWSK